MALRSHLSQTPAARDDSPENAGKPWYCPRCRVVKELGYTFSLDLDPNHTPGDCRQRDETKHEQLVASSDSYACECPICWPAFASPTELEEIDALVASLDDIQNTKFCNDCETSIYACTCEDKKCKFCHRPFGEVRKCEVYPDACTFHCDQVNENHAHLQCMSGKHEGEGIVEGDWEYCDSLTNGICEDHEYCKECCPGYEESCEHENWNLEESSFEHGEFYAHFHCDNCGACGNIRFDEDDIEPE